MSYMTAPDVSKLREEFKTPHELIKTSDGKTIFLRQWVGSNRTDLAILIFHGITAYSEPYGKLIAEEIAGAGFNVFGMDLRGHGLSDGNRGDYPSRERLSKDLCETIRFLKGKYSKVVVLGHSLGVLSAVVAGNSCPTGIDGMILVSAGRKIRPGAYAKPTTLAALKTLVAITLFPRRPMIEYGRSGMVGRNNPLFNFRYSARFYSVIYGTSALSVVRMFAKNEIVSPNMIISKSLDIPMLVVVGDQDEIFPVESARALFDSIECKRKEFLVISGGRHATFPGGSWVQLIAWLTKNYEA
jgi:alpha-beta hydrolase superfamily lysophospholipase